MESRRRTRWALAAQVARGVLVLAAMLLLPLAATLQAPRPGAAQSTGQDSLWAAAQYLAAVCANPSSPEALASCFASPVSTYAMQQQISSSATDGVNVYFAGLNGGLSCPIAGLGSNCTRIMAGSWPPRYDCPALKPNGPCQKLNYVNGLAAADGQIWIGQSTGEIYRCPANVPYVKQDKSPSQCVLLDDAGHRPVSSLLLANGRLYAGLDCYDQCIENRKQGLLWSCDPYTVNSCFTLDSYGETTAYSLTAGGGYLWAGLGNGIVWRCDLNNKNACKDWATTGASVNSISYDGRSTLYAASGDRSSKDSTGSILSCSTSQVKTCSNVLTGINGYAVAAGAGGVFSGSDLHFGTAPYSAAYSSMYGPLLYLPADGTAGVGGVSVKMRAQALGRKLAKRCENRGKAPQATVVITGENGFAKTVKAGACGLLNDGTVSATIHLLDPGQYTAKVMAGTHSGQASFTVAADRTKRVSVKLMKGLHH